MLYKNQCYADDLMSSPSCIATLSTTGDCTSASASPKSGHCQLLLWCSYCSKWGDTLACTAYCSRFDLSLLYQQHTACCSQCDLNLLYRYHTAKQHHYHVTKLSTTGNFSRDSSSSESGLCQPPLCCSHCLNWGTGQRSQQLQHVCREPAPTLCTAIEVVTVPELLHLHSSATASHCCG